VPIHPLNVEELCAIVARSAQAGKPLSPVGGGVQQHIGYPPSADAEVVSLAGLNRLIEYSPDDMVVIAEAGMMLNDLQSALAVHNQWLPLEVAAPDRQTIGGIVATRAMSAARAGFGSVRDWLIGLAVVGGDGQLVRGGGKVVKNVSGYDLPKLYCGSWGTLGIITEAAFKLAPLPRHTKTLLALVSGDRNSEEALDSLLGTVHPTSTHLLNGAAARDILGLDAEDAQYLAVRFAGAEIDVEFLAGKAAAALAPYAASVLDLPSGIAMKLNAALRDFSLNDSPLSVRYNILSSQVGAFSRMIEWTANKAGMSAAVCTECRTGVVYAQIRPHRDGAGWAEYYPSFRDKSDRVGGSMVIERMPDEWRDMGTPVWSPLLPEFELMRAIKQALDPKGIFNPGRFVGGL
jgi:glycolate oxidase FAD binding subunit